MIVLLGMIALFLSARASEPYENCSACGGSGWRKDPNGDGQTAKIPCGCGS